MINSIFIKDPTQPGGFSGEILQTKEITDNCSVYFVQLTDADYVSTPIPVVVYADGYQFTPWDWQAGYDEIPDDLSDIRWISQGGVEAIMIDGLPHIMADWHFPTVIPQEITVLGFGQVEKMVTPGNKTSSRINLPLDWQGKRVAVIRLDP